MEELDRKNIIQHETKVEDEASSNFTTTSVYKNMFPFGMEQEKFEWKISRLIKFNRGIDRPKSYNPWMDRVENDKDFRRKLAETDLHKESFVKEVESQVWPDQPKVDNKIRITVRPEDLKANAYKRILRILGIG